MSLIEGPNEGFFSKCNQSSGRYYPYGRYEMSCSQEDDIGGGIWQPVIARAPNTHAHQHAIKRHLYSQHGIGCQLLHVCRLQVACVPRIGAGVNYLPLLPPPAPLACRVQD